MQIKCCASFCYKHVKTNVCLLDYLLAVFYLSDTTIFYNKYISIIRHDSHIGNTTSIVTITTQYKLHFAFYVKYSPGLTNT